MKKLLLLFTLTSFPVLAVELPPLDLNGPNVCIEVVKVKKKVVGFSVPRNFLFLDNDTESNKKILANFHKSIGLKTVKNKCDVELPRSLLEDTPKKKECVPCAITKN